MNYNPTEEESPFKSFRLTLSDPVLVESISEVQRKTGLSEKELCKDAIIGYLEEKNQIKLE